MKSTKMIERLENSVTDLSALTPLETRAIIAKLLAADVLANEAKMVLETLACVQSALRDIKSVYNEHENTLLGSGMRYDLTNLWNCSEYIAGLKEPLTTYELAGEGEKDQ